MLWRPQAVNVLATAERSTRKETENEVKKKIRAIQYGVGPSVHRLRG